MLTKFEQFLHPDTSPGIKIDMLFRIMCKLGHTTFTSGELNLNIIGIRTLDDTPNVFNDWLALWYYARVKSSKMEYTRPFFHLWPITTDPGTYYLKNPLKLAGTMILKEGQYRSVYKLDKHRGKYTALCQRLGPVTVYRDRNKDEKLDMEPDSIMHGWYGCNIHRASKFGPLEWINKYSAGCQVFRNPHHFNTFITLCEAAKEKWGNHFTYTLINEKNFDMLK